VLEDIQTAMREQRLCRLGYRSRSSGGQRSYLAAPIQIIAYRETLYLRCRLHGLPAGPAPTFRTLAINRISHLSITRQTFAKTAQDGHEPHFGFPFHQPIQIRAAFWGTAAEYVSERIWSAGQTIKKRPGHAIELTFTATSSPEVIAWILSFGPDAELLEPQELRVELRDILDRLAKRYGIAGGLRGEESAAEQKEQHLLSRPSRRECPPPADRECSSPRHHSLQRGGKKR
jgi:predicted DNA-binding transcriptional regulator YafY